MLSSEFGHKRQLGSIFMPLDVDLQVRGKTGCSEVEVDLPLDVDSINYDRTADPQVLIEKMVCFLLHLIYCSRILRYFC